VIILIVCGLGAEPAVGAMANLPALSIAAPAAGAHVRNPVTVVIDTPGNITDLTMGAMSGSSMSSMSGPQLRLHIVVDGHEYMPTAMQLSKVGPDRYKYCCRSLRPDSTRFRCPG
jgi:hypothetical protein